MADFNDTNVCGTALRLANVSRALDVMVDEAKLSRAGSSLACTPYSAHLFLHVLRLLCSV